nr:acyl carrier protein [Micromonospora sp. DSM 115978]
MTTSTEQIVDELTTIVVQELAVAADQLTPDTDLRTLDGADSVKMLRVVAKVEKRYDVELDDDDVFSVSTIAEVAAVVHHALLAAAAG